MILNYNKLGKQNKGSKSVVCARVGGANTTSFPAAHFAEQNTKSGGSESPSSRTLRVHYGAGEGGAGILFPPNPLSFPPRPSGQISRPSGRKCPFKKGSRFVQ
jgi:hypothetical protein